MFEKINESDITKRGVRAIANTPGRKVAFGESNMTPEQLKEKFDRLPKFLADKLNELLVGLSTGDLAKYLFIEHDGTLWNLESFVAGLLDGNVDHIQIKTVDGIIYLTELGNKTQELYNGVETGDLASKIIVREKVTLLQFYEAFEDLKDKSIGPRKVSELENDSKFIKASEAPVQSVNGKGGSVFLVASDVGARPSTWTPNYEEVGADKSGTASSLVGEHNTGTDAHNDIRLELKALSDRINAVLDSDDTTLDELSEIVAYIKSNKALIDAITANKISYTDIINDLITNVTNKPLSAAQGVALKALIDAITVPTKLSQLENDKKFITKSEAPVQSVNNKTGNVELDAEDVGARPNTWTPTASDVGARPATWMPSYSDVGAEKAGNVNTHNTNGAAHNDIRLLIQGLSDRLNAIANSDDTTLDDFKEVVAYIKSNKALIDAITTNKISYTDVINNLVTNVTNKPLSAAQGVALKALIDAITVPTKLSQLENDKKFITKSEAPVQSVNNKTGDVSLDINDLNCSSETWTFTLADGSTIRKNVVINNSSTSDPS